MNIRWGLIGSGRMNHTMAPAIQAAKNSHITAVYSRDLSRATEFATQFQIHHAYDSLEAMLQNSDIDVVYVASPNGLHVQHAVASANAGKHVFCEKPLAITIKGCKDIIEACQKNNVKLGLGVMFRQHPAHQMAKSIIANGDLGQLLQAHARLAVSWLVSQPAWYENPNISGGGIINMAGIHRIDLLQYLVGSEIYAVIAQVGPVEKHRNWEQWASTLLEFENGAQGTIQLDLRVPFNKSTIEIHGTLGSIVLSGTTTSWWGGGGGELQFTNSEGVQNFQFDLIDLYRAEVEDFNDAIRLNSNPMAGGRDGLICAQVSIAWFESAQANGMRMICKTPKMKSELL